MAPQPALLITLPSYDPTAGDDSRMTTKRFDPPTRASLRADGWHGAIGQGRPCVITRRGHVQLQPSLSAPELSDCATRARFRPCQAWPRAMAQL